MKRDKNNYRIFNDANINWIKSIHCLKKCGMGIQEMKNYIDLCLQGQKSISERKIILDRLKQELSERIKALEANVAYINSKQQFYDDVLFGKVKYYSNIIKVED